MNYLRHYNLLIQRAHNRSLVGYTEKHHIVPKCLGGSDAADNIIILSAREHFVGHLLLMQAYPCNRKLVYAAHMMCVVDPRSQTSRINNREYAWLSEKFAKAISKSQSGKGNSQYASMWVCSSATRISKKIAKGSIIPDGWTKGRNTWKPQEKRQKKAKARGVRKVFRNDSEKRKALYLLDVYKKYGFTSIRQFCLSEFYNKSHVTLTKLWKVYIPNYAILVRQGVSTKL